jgi:hypothetical protein
VKEEAESVRWFSVVLETLRLRIMIDDVSFSESKRLLARYRHRCLVSCQLEDQSGTWVAGKGMARLRQHATLIRPHASRVENCNELYHPPRRLEHQEFVDDTTNGLLDNSQH